MSVKLHYFGVRKIRARADPIMALAAYGGVPVELVEYDLQQFMARKEQLPLGQLPIIEVDGLEIPESGAISRYIAARAGLIPSDPLRLAVADAAFELAQEAAPIINPIVNIYNDQQLEQELEKFNACKTKYLRCLQKLLSDSKFYGGDRPTYADFGVHGILSNFLAVDKKCLDDYPELAELMKRIEGLDGVKEYLAGRPPLPEDRLEALK